MKSKKVKNLRGRFDFSNYLKGAIKKKIFGNPDVEQLDYLR